MQEYYRLLKEGWDEGAEFIKYEFNMNVTWMRDQQYYFDYFIDIDTADGVHIYSAIQDALTKAWEAADDRAKEFIRYPYECFMDYERLLA